MSGFMPPVDVKTGKIGGGGDFPRTLGQRIILGIIVVAAIGVLVYLGLR